MAKKVKISKGERTKGFINGFKDFVLRGNVIDMAVGVIIGGAFGKIVTSLVNDIILPPIGVLLGGVEFRELQALISSSPVLDENSNQVIIDGVLQFNNVYIRYGNLIQTLVEFLIIAISIYVVLYIFIKRREQEAKLILAEEERLKKLEEENKPEEPEVVSPDILLLTEIRDLLKKDE